MNALRPAAGLVAAAVFAALAAAPAAHAESITEKTGVNSMLGVSPSTPDFVRQVAISDMFEIQSSMLAKQRGDAAEQAFAEKMIEAHGKTTAALKTLIADHKINVDLPHALDNSHQGKLDALKELTGADFNKRYRDDQVKAHKDAIDLFERYAKGGDNEALKQWASATLPELRSHLDMADKLQVAENMVK